MVTAFAIFGMAMAFVIGLLALAFACSFIADFYSKLRNYYAGDMWRREAERWEKRALEAEAKLEEAA